MGSRLTRPMTGIAYEGDRCKTPTTSNPDGWWGNDGFVVPVSRGTVRVEENDAGDVIGGWWSWGPDGLHTIF